MPIKDDGGPPSHGRGLFLVPGVPDLLDGHDRGRTHPNPPEHPPGPLSRSPALRAPAPVAARSDPIGSQWTP